MIAHAQLRLFWVVVLTILPLAPVSSAFGAETSETAPLSFERHVRPILKEHCFQCHGERKNPRNDLDLRLVRTMIEGGLSGEAIVPGHREDSFLWMLIEDDEMPPVDTKLSDQQKQIIGAWIEQGARTERPEPDDIPPPGMLLTEEERGFWSFQPISHPEPPVVDHAEQVETPIDAFLLSRLEAEGLTFSPEADRRTLIRRATIDLTGLPPTPDEVETFLADDRPDAYERLIDRLLDSPRYGERWARHWMDVAGYADSEGYTLADPERPWAYKYRDYLVRSINADRPWNTLIVEQLAGDELVGPALDNLTDEQAEILAATGFLRMAPDGTADGEVDQAAARNDVVAETIKIVSTSLLGLTVGCAQCHSHRYDPISHEDYYRFRAIFEPALDPEHWRKPSQRLVSLWTDEDRAQAAKAAEAVKKVADERSAAIDELVSQVLEKELEAAPEELRPKLREAREVPRKERTEEQEKLLKSYPRVLVTPGNVNLYDAKAHKDVLAKYAKPLAEAQALRPADDYVRALTEVPGQVPTTHLFERGDHAQPAQALEPAELTVLTGAAGTPEIPVNDPERPTTGRRLAYARHLTSGQHPLVARVLMNRVWMNHFGRGLVASPGDFGRLGERPSHPELLDWLAEEFMRGGWTLKRIHRLLMTSTAYRQASTRRPDQDAIDPDNRLLARMNVRRLEAESVRDAILSTSGQLNTALFGPPVPVAPDEVGQFVVGKDTRDSAGRPSGGDQDLGARALRRSLYIQVRRTMPLSLTEPFDPADMAPNCERRSSSTVSSQSLMLMNNAFVLDQAEAIADRVMGSACECPSERVRTAWGLILCQEPSEDQVAEAVAFLEAQSAEFAENRPDDKDKKKAKDAVDPARQALASFCHALLCSNGFLYVD